LTPYQLENVSESKNNGVFSLRTRNQGFKIVVSPFRFVLLQLGDVGKVYYGTPFRVDKRMGVFYPSDGTIPEYDPEMIFALRVGFVFNHRQYTPNIIRMNKFEQ
jgi:hypothetical protein